MPTFSGSFGAGFFGNAFGKRFCSRPIDFTTGSTGFASAAGLACADGRARAGAWAFASALAVGFASGA